MLDPASIQRLARCLDDARLELRCVEPLTKSDGEFSLDSAYAILHAGIALREGRGERVIGAKMGLTSKAKREQMNLRSPIYGLLTDAMRVHDGGTFSLARSLHAKIEPEVAFVTARPLAGEVTRAEALAACSGVCAAMEILDSRFVGFKYFSLPDVIADDCSSSHFVISAELQSPLLEVADLEMRLSIDGVLAQQGRTSAISGHPADSLVQLCAMLHQHGRTLPAGSIVLAGAATVAETLRPGQEIALEIPGLGAVRVRTSP